MPPYKVIVTIQENEAGRWEYSVQIGGLLQLGSAATFDDAQTAVKATLTSFMKKAS